MCIRFFISVLLPLWTGMSVFAATSSSVTQDGITWTFDKSYETGQFVNGEWWVVGPVTLKSVSPGAATDGGLDINGSMINPAGLNTHGLDARGAVAGTYQEGLNIAKQLPLLISVGSSILSAVSHVPYEKPALDKAAVLTVLSATPPAGSFRPPYFGTEKPMYNKSRLNYDVFHDLAAPPGAPTLSSLTNGTVKKVLISLNGSGGAQKDSELKTRAAPSYGREISAAHGTAALALNLDYSDAEKEPLLIELVQRGIDVYGGIKAGFTWNADGGHRMGYKMPLYIAGKALGASEILHYVNTDAFKSEGGGSNEVANYDRFQEGQQHFYVDQATIDAGTGFVQADLGLPEWIGQAWTDIRTNPSRSSKADWGNGYRQMNSSRNTTNVLVMTLMGDRDLWNHEAMFDYIITRYWPAELAGDNADGSNGVSLFTKYMWMWYFGRTDPPQSAIKDPVLRPVAGVSQPNTVSGLWRLDGTSAGRFLPGSGTMVPGLYLVTEGNVIRPVIFTR